MYVDQGREDLRGQARGYIPVWPSLLKLKVVVISRGIDEFAFLRSIGGEWSICTTAVVCINQLTGAKTVLLCTQNLRSDYLENQFASRLQMFTLISSLLLDRGWSTNVGQEHPESPIKHG